MEVKNDQLGYNEKTFMSVFYAYILVFSVAIYKQNYRTGNSVCEKCTKFYLK